MAHRNRIQPHERLVAGADQVALDDDSAEGIRPVEHDHRLSRGGARFERERRRPLESVDARADVLQVDDEGIDVGEHLRGRAAGLRVEAEDRDAEARVGAVRRLDHVVLTLTRDAVLRSEERGQPGAAQPVHDVAGGHQSWR